MRPPGITRRHAIQIAGAGFLVGSAPRGAAAEGTPVDGHIRRGEFDAAAKLFQAEVDQFPLNRDGRLILGKLHFGNRNFEAAAREFATVEKRGGIQDDFKIIDLGELLAIGSVDDDAFIHGSRFKDSASWLYLTELRQGRDATLPAGPRESIRSVLRAETSVTDYVRIQEQAMTAVLDQVAQQYGSAGGISEAVAAGKKNLERELNCVAHFALAEQALGRNDASVARKNLSTAIATEADGIIEYHVVKSELGRLN